MNYVIIPIISIVIALIGLKISKKLNLLDKPGPDIVPKRNPVPTMQGIFVFIAFFAVVGLLFPEYLSNQIFLGLIAGSGIIVLFSFLDELNYIGKSKIKIPTIVRLLSHVVGGIVAVYVGGINMPELIIGDMTFMIPQWLFVIFFIVWSIICINAINWFDGVNSQASGVSSIGFLTIFLLIKFVVLKHYVGISDENFQILELTQNLSFILFVISLIYTVVEYKPIGLVRDLGLMFFGFSIAYLSVVGGTKIGTLVVALSLVIFDAIWVGLHRLIFLKKNPLKGDYTHLHYRLLGLKWTKHETRAFVWLWSLMMMILMLLQGAHRMNKLIIFVMMALIFFGVNGYIFWIKKTQCGLDLKKDS